MTWREAHRIAMVAAAHAHRDLGIDVEQPIDVFAAIESSGVLLAFEPFPKLSGAYVAESDAPLGIVINSNHPLSRQRFTAGHEFGHHRLGHGTSVDPEIDPLNRWGSSDPSDPEKIAEAFAAWFLMPRRLVLRCLNDLDLKQPESSSEVYQLSLRLGTSYEATARHLPNLRLASRSSVSSWLRTPPAQIKRATAGEWVPTDLHNDVFEWNGRGDSAVLLARPGDRLVFRLREIPTSGYVWQILELPSTFALVADEYTDADDDPEIAGGSTDHVVVVGVNNGDRSSTATIRMTKARPWDKSDASAATAVELRIEPPRRGVDESYFVAA